MVSIVSRSPFEYYPTVAPTGGGIGAAFQAGQAAANELERGEFLLERGRALLPFELQEKQTLDELRRQQTEISKAQEGRTAADYARTGAAFDAAGNVVPTGARPVATAATPGAALITSAQAQAVRNQLMPTWQGLERAYGLPAGFLDRTASIESGYNPAAQREGSQFAGLFQIGPAAARDLDLPLEARLDPTRASEGAAQYAARNAQSLQRTLGRQPEGWELYLAHQQGAGGASALLSNPQRSALDALTAAYQGDRQRAEQAIIQNGGDLRMTAGQFASLWRGKYGGGEAPAAPAAGLTPPERAAPALPAGALGEGFVTRSSGGVPMTVSDADLYAPGGQYAQFMAPGPNRMTPVAAPLDAQGRPVNQPATTDPRAARIAEIDAEIAATYPNPRAVSLLGGLVNPIVRGIENLAGRTLPPDTEASLANIDRLLQERGRLANELRTEQRFPGTRAAAEDVARRLQSGDYAGAAGRIVGGALGATQIGSLDFSRMFPRATAQVQSTAETMAQQRAAGNQVGAALTNVLNVPRVVGSGLYDIFAPPVTGATQLGLNVLGGPVPQGAVSPVTPGTPSTSFGANAPIAAGFSPVGAGGTQFPGAISPVPVGAQTQGLLTQRAAPPTPTPAPAPSGAPGAAPTAPAPSGAPGAASTAPAIPALIEPATIARDRQVLEAQRQALMTQRQIAIATRNPQLLATADVALAGVAGENIRLGGMEALTRFRGGDPAALADYFYTMTNGAMRLQQNPDNTYNVLNGDQTTARNLSPQTLENYFRASFDKNVIDRIATMRQTDAARADLFYKTQLTILEETSKQEASGTRDQALEKLKAAIKVRTGQEPKMEIQNDRVYIFDPNNQRVSVGRFTNMSVDGKTKLPANQERLQFDQGVYNTVLTQP